MIVSRPAVPLRVVDPTIVSLRLTVTAMTATELLPVVVPPEGTVTNRVDPIGTNEVTPLLPATIPLRHTEATATSETTEDLLQLPPEGTAIAAHLQMTTAEVPLRLATHLQIIVVPVAMIMTIAEAPHTGMKAQALDRDVEALRTRPKDAGMTPGTCLK